MRETDIVIVGGGLAGSMAAAMLGRTGYQIVLVDPRYAYPPDFRCEKLDASQVHLLRRAGLAEEVLRSATLNEEVWIARFGRLVEKRRTVQYGMAYPALVNAMRSQIPAEVPFVHDKATRIVTSSDRQTVTLSSGDEIAARLVVLANGLNDGLRRSVGMASRELSACHSISVGFNVAPRGRTSFDSRR
jgi:2-polyprenyl-6-methoxyphenol hydroxylase-like FAD-dependent oxidoreductase